MNTFTSLFIILIMLIIYTIYINKKILKDAFNNIIEYKNKTAFCLLVRKPNIVWLEFLNTFVDDYDVYIVIDDYDNDYDDLINKFEKINFIQISDDECIKNGYINSDYWFYYKQVVSTDRAYYYFNKINNNYSYIWFCEDDIFFNDKNILLELDKKYSHADFIVPGMEINTKGNSDKRWQHWGETDNYFELPWAHWHICICRISNNLMKKVEEFVTQHKKLNYKEFMFHTLALHNNMSIEIPIELKETIIWHDNKFNAENIKLTKTYKPIYHPVKNIDDHKNIRNNKE